MDVYKQVVFGFFILSWFGAVADYFQFSKFRGASHPVYEYKLPSVSYEEDSYEYSSGADYSFEFGVDDKEEGNLQRHQERRKGDRVQGEYSVLDPDGYLRTVTYSVLPHTGFLATTYSIPYKGGRSAHTKNGRIGVKTLKVL